jgi:hypothetical protein
MLHGEAEPGMAERGTAWLDGARLGSASQGEDFNSINLPKKVCHD